MLTTIPSFSDEPDYFDRYHPAAPGLIRRALDKSIVSHELALDLYIHLSSELPLRCIEILGQPYLERYFLGTHEGSMLYLHRFVSPSGDGDRHVHNHPMSVCQSMIVTGGYEEIRGTMKSDNLYPQVTRMQYRKGDQHVIHEETVHQIVAVAPETWTLFHHTPWIRDWGFFEPLPNGTTRFVIENGESKNRNWWLRNPPGAESERQPFLSMQSMPAVSTVQ